MPLFGPPARPLSHGPKRPATPPSFTPQEEVERGSKRPGQAHEAIGNAAHARSACDQRDRGPVLAAVALAQAPSHTGGRQGPQSGEGRPRVPLAEPSGPPLSIQPTSARKGARKRSSPHAAIGWPCCNLDARLLQDVSVTCRVSRHAWLDSSSQGRRFDPCTAPSGEMPALRAFLLSPRVARKAKIENRVSRRIPMSAKGLRAAHGALSFRGRLRRLTPRRQTFRRSAP
jgi:hypothetical protein